MLIFTFGHLSFNFIIEYIQHYMFKDSAIRRMYL